ncbi:unnamed protein product, partial [Meganyctiphanes norvegica]
MGKKVLIAITLMTLVSINAEKLGTSPSENTNDQSSERRIRSDFGSTFNQGNPSFNSFNQASSGNFGPGELIFTQVSGSSFDGAPGSLNQGPRGSNVILLGSPQGSGFNFGSQAGSNFRGSNFNAGRPVSNLVTGFGPRFEQRPNSYYGSSSLPQGPRSSFPIFTLGSTQGSLRQIPSGFESRSPFGSSFRQGSSSTGSGFGTEFNVSPARGSFQGSSVGSGISQGNLQTSI